MELHVCRDKDCGGVGKTMDADLFNPVNLQETTNCSYGVSSQVSLGHCAFTSDVRLNNLGKENFRLQSLSFAFLRMN
ncbi:MAG: hypothetical protein KBS81_05970 [Spirochaetales bacterium]|nr:hypothetical protein [Candidatus Physcosoma equi]